MSKPCRLIEVSGAPFERGNRHGIEAAAEIRAGIAHYAAQVRDLGLTETQLTQVVEAYLPRIEAFEPTHVEEMRGIAAGADVPFHHIVMLNARTEVLKLAGNPENRDRLLAPDGCTTVVACPEAAAEGRLIHAHNWDWKSECAKTTVVLRIRRDDGPDILTFTEAGALGRFGFNAAGICFTGNYLECERDYRRLGVPLVMIRRKVLEQATYALALQCAWTTPKSGSNNMAISHSGGGLVFDLECAPDETFSLELQGGLLVHANHWQSAAALAKVRETGIAATPDSLFRERRTRGLLSPKLPHLTLDDIRLTLQDDWESPWSICRPPRPSVHSDLSATVATLLMQPEIGLMEVAMLPALGAVFTAYTLEMQAGARFAAPMPRAPAGDARSRERARA